jgi:hypothetical protein
MGLRAGSFAINPVGQVVQVLTVWDGEEYPYQTDGDRLWREGELTGIDRVPFRTQKEYKRPVTYSKGNRSFCLFRIPP